MINISKKLKELRSEQELTQEQVAEVLRVSRVVYNRYENNKREIPLEQICKLADYYKVTVDYLVGRED